MSDNKIVSYGYLDAAAVANVIGLQVQNLDLIPVTDYESHTLDSAGPIIIDTNQKIWNLPGFSLEKFHEEENGQYTLNVHDHIVSFIKKGNLIVMTDTFEGGNFPYIENIITEVENKFKSKFKVLKLKNVYDNGQNNCAINANINSIAIPYIIESLEKNNLPVNEHNLKTAVSLFKPSKELTELIRDYDNLKSRKDNVNSLIVDLKNFLKINNIVYNKDAMKKLEENRQNLNMSSVLDEIKNIVTPKSFFNKFPIKISPPQKKKFLEIITEKVYTLDNLKSQIRIKYESEMKDNFQRLKAMTDQALVNQTQTLEHITVNKQNPLKGFKLSDEDFNFIKEELKSSKTTVEKEQNMLGCCLVILIKYGLRPNVDNAFQVSDLFYDKLKKNEAESKNAPSVSNVEKKIPSTEKKDLERKPLKNNTSMPEKQEKSTNSSPKTLPTAKLCDETTKKIESKKGQKSSFLRRLFNSRNKNLNPNSLQR